MKLLFKQKFFSWFDSYNIFDESGKTIYTIKGQLSWGHKLQIYTADGANVATVKEVVFTFMPRFELYVNGNMIGSLKKKFAFFKPQYSLDFNGWQVSGNFMEWDYIITDSAGCLVAKVSKELFHWTDVYTIDVVKPADTLFALMFTVAIDAEKCSRS